MPFTTGSFRACASGSRTANNGVHGAAPGCPGLPARPENARPIGEGRIIDGCVTCPWHGYQYRLEDGRAPPPFTEVLTTYRVRIKNGVVEVDPRPLPPGTAAGIVMETT